MMMAETTHTDSPWMWHYLSMFSKLIHSNFWRKLDLGICKSGLQNIQVRGFEINAYGSLKTSLKVKIKN